MFWLCHTVTELCKDLHLAIMALLLLVLARIVTEKEVKRKHAFI